MKRFLSILIVLHSFLLAILLVFGSSAAALPRLFLACLSLLLGALIWWARKNSFQQYPKTLALVLAGLVFEYYFWIFGATVISAWHIVYLLATETFRAGCLVLLLRSDDTEAQMLRFAKVYFIPAAFNTFLWVISRWEILEPPFTPYGLFLLFCIMQISVYEVLRRNTAYHKQEDSAPGEPQPATSFYGKVEHIAAWLAYCISGYREPEKTNRTAAKKPSPPEQNP